MSGKKRLYGPIFVLILIMVCLLWIPNPAVVQGESLAEIQEKLTEISDAEKAILEDLFLLVQEIDAIEREEAAISGEIDAVHVEIERIEVNITQEERSFAHLQDVLQQVLKGYQRKGPGSFLEIVLDSDSLAIFLRRLNILRDLTRNTGKLLEDLQESAERLASEKVKLNEKILLLEQKQEELRASLVKKLLVKEDMENYLASLEEERMHFEQQLERIAVAWDELKPLFSSMAREFSLIIEEGNFPPDALEITFALFNVKATMEEKTFNDILAGHPRLPAMEFIFRPGTVDLHVNDSHLVLTGTFVIEDGHTLLYEVKGGSFYGLPLETGALEDLFQGGPLKLDLRPLLDGSLLNAIEIKNGSFDLRIQGLGF